MHVYCGSNVNHAAAEEKKKEPACSIAGKQEIKPHWLVVEEWWRLVGNSEQVWNVIIQDVTVLALTAHPISKPLFLPALNLHT